MSENICELCHKELSEEKGELAHGCLTCTGMPCSDLVFVFFLRKQIKEANRLILEAKRIYAPNTTNSEADDYISKYIKEQP
jgi:hypothetical protein